MLLNFPPFYLDLQKTDYNKFHIWSIYALSIVLQLNVTNEWLQIFCKSKGR